MIESFQQIALQFQDSPMLQGAVAGFCTFFFEDPTVVSSGLLIAGGHMHFLPALVGLSLGITLGDFGLYILGWFFRDRIRSWNWISAASFRKAERVLKNNLVAALAGSRFMPGTRIPVYVGAGVFCVSPFRFLAIQYAASLVWVTAMLLLVVKLGEKVGPMLGNAKWVVLAVVVIGYIAFSMRKKPAAPEEAEEAEEPEEAPVSSFELAGPWFYIPVGFYYVWLAIKHRGLTLPSLANPSIYSGGICRESKSKILALIPEEFALNVPAWTVVRKQSADSETETARAVEALAAAGIDFPVVAKPDEGQRGAGVRLIESPEKLRCYLDSFQADVPILFQRLASWESEAGVLWCRHPKEKQGRIISLTLKEFPRVTGDGRRTVRELILADPRARLMRETYFRKHEAEVLDSVLPEGESLRLNFTGNHCQGTIFLNGAEHVTPELTARIGQIADAMPEFYFGRFDLKYRDIEALRSGEYLEILEVNGASAESTHIWDPRMTLGGAYKALFKQFRILFEIGEENRRRGFQPTGALTILRDFRDYLRNARQYPVSQ